MSKITMLTAQHSTAQHSTAQHSTFDYRLNNSGCQVFLMNWGRFYVAPEKKDDDARMGRSR